VRRAGRRTVVGVALAALAALGLSACANLGYYWQSAHGHVDLLRAARPVSQWIADPATSDALRARLELTQRIRRFAVDELALPDNRSYTGYADLHRNAAVWNVVAAPPYSLTLKTWCFPVAGCVGYRGYYAEADARAEAAAQAAQGLETAVYPVPAYSTLGWLDWAGGDPLLNTFIGYPEGELARLIFHELAHQVVYVPGDTLFNESFATAVERLGGMRWLAERAGEPARAEYAQFDARRRQFRALTLATRQRLQAVYATPAARAGDAATVEPLKRAVMDTFRAEFATLRATWPPQRQAAYDGWIARANNAMFGAQAAYDALVPAFEAVFEREGRDWPRFYAEVRRIAALPPAERRAALPALPPTASASAE
jgi:predicted aminopeptidase